jgi:hypothetical protein
MSKTRQITLDGEAADRITVLNLQECRGYLKKELRDFKKGKYLHPEDVAGNIKLIEAMDLVIKYYGG